MGYYIFLYAGFIKSVPIALEEAAKIDGCDRDQVFVRIVFPLLKPITMTVVVLCFLASWNDFFLPLIMVQKDEVKTLPLMQFFFRGIYQQHQPGIRSLHSFYDSGCSILLKCTEIYRQA